MLLSFPGNWAGLAEQATLAVNVSLFFATSYLDL